MNESRLIEDSRIFEGHDLDPFLVARACASKMRPDKLWLGLTKKVSKLVYSSGHSFVNDPIARQIRVFLRKLVKESGEVLDICGGGHSYIASDVLDVSMGAMKLNQNARVLFECDMNMTPDFAGLIGDKRYDMVTLINGMAYLTRPYEVFESAIEVLKPGGLMATGFDDRYDEGPDTLLWHMISEIVGEAFGGEGPACGKPDYALDMRWRKGLVACFMRRAGFTAIRSHTLPTPKRGIYLSDHQQPFTFVVGRKPR